MNTLTFLILLFPLTGLGIAQGSTPNWGGNYAPCKHHADLLNRNSTDLAVRISTSNQILGQQFAKAMDFWSSVLDVDWHATDSQDCAIQLVDGTPQLFNFCRCLSARSQLPDRDDFQGWIAFNPRMTLSKQEMFLDSVHEIGHLLGLSHNSNQSSVMYYFGLDRPVSLDTADLQTLAARHRLRPRIEGKRERMKGVRITMPGESELRAQVWLRDIVAWMRPLRFWSNGGASASIIASRNSASLESGISKMR